MYSLTLIVKVNIRLGSIVHMERSTIPVLYYVGRAMPYCGLCIIVSLLHNAQEAGGRRAESREDNVYITNINIMLCSYISYVICICTILLCHDIDITYT